MGKRLFYGGERTPNRNVEQCEAYVSVYIFVREVDEDGVVTAVMFGQK